MIHLSNIVLVIFLSSILATTFAQNKNQNDLKKENLKGRVQSITDNEFSVNSNQGDITKNELWNTYTYSYNQKGNRLEETYHQSSGYSDINKYDGDGNMIESEAYNAGSTEPITSTFKFKYDKKKNIIEKYQYQSDGKLCYTYTYINDNQGNPIEENQYQSYQDGSFMSRKSFKYDNKGNLIERNSFDPTYQHPHQKCTNKYDNNCNIIDVCRFFEPETIPYEKNTYKYENFDKEGNWQKKVYYLNSYPRTITERVIEYYNGTSTNPKLNSSGDANIKTSFQGIQSFFDFFKQAVKDNNFRILSAYLDFPFQNFKTKNEFINGFNFSGDVRSNILNTISPRKNDVNLSYSIDGTDQSMGALYQVNFKLNKKSLWRWNLTYFD
jgi:hypothetical protein